MFSKIDLKLKEYEDKVIYKKVKGVMEELLEYLSQFTTVDMKEEYECDWDRNTKLTISLNCTDIITVSFNRESEFGFEMNIWSYGDSTNYASVRVINSVEELKEFIVSVIIKDDRLCRFLNTFKDDE